MKRQLAFFIARAQIPIEWIHPKAGDEEDESEVELEPDLQECLFNTKLSPFFREFGKELGVEEAKSLEDVYKSHLENTSELSGTSSFIVLLTTRHRTRNFGEYRFGPWKSRWHLR